MLGTCIVVLLMFTRLTRHVYLRGVWPASTHVVNTVVRWLWCSAGVCTCVCVCVTLSPSLSTDVPAPAPVCLTMEKVYDSATRLPRPEVLKEHFVKEGRLEEDVALAIIREGACMHVRT